MAKFYITTPIYYVNDVPHIGHAYSTIAADVLARYHRRRGDDVFFLTGTDEHGANVAQAAAVHGRSPQEYCDEISGHFQRSWQSLDISNDYFIRTTDPLHEQTVQAFMQRLYEKGDIYKGLYEGKYCLGCEKFLADDELVDGLCPNHRREPIWYSEENYFFRLSRYGEALIQALGDEREPHHYRVESPARRNEVLGKLRVGLADISVSRASLTWGIPLPFDRSQTTYVWVDALLNYITAAGYLQEPERFAHYWPADLHLMAKDILWFHAIVWPAMLVAAGLPVPRRIYAHGFFTVEGQKMSKSLGNVIRPHELIERFGVDSTRYLLLSAFPFGTDGDISESSFVERYNADLANDLGNLLNRTVSMINRYCAGAVPAPQGEETPTDADLRACAAEAFSRMHRAMDELAFSEALAAIWRLVGRANKYVEENAPWALARTDRQRLATVLYNLAETLRLVAEAVEPFMPGAAARVAGQLGTELTPVGVSQPATAWGSFPAGARTTPQPQPLFPRLS